VTTASYVGPCRRRRRPDLNYLGPLRRLDDTAPEQLVKGEAEELDLKAELARARVAALEVVARGLQPSDEASAPSFIAPFRRSSKSPSRSAIPASPSARAKWRAICKRKAQPSASIRKLCARTSLHSTNWCTCPTLSARSARMRREACAHGRQKAAAGRRSVS
jgi:hypothetical protein